MCTEYPVEMLIDPVDNLVYHTALLINKRVISYGRSGCQIVNEEEYRSKERVFLGKTKKTFEDIEKYAMDLNESDFKDYSLWESNCNMFTNRVMNHALGWTFKHGLRKPQNIQEIFTVIKYYLDGGFDAYELVEASNKYYRETNQLQWDRHSKLTNLNFFAIVFVSLFGTLIVLSIIGPFNFFPLFIKVVVYILQRAICCFGFPVYAAVMSTVQVVYKSRFIWRQIEIQGCLQLMYLYKFWFLAMIYIAEKITFFLEESEESGEGLESLESFITKNSVLHLLLLLFGLSYSLQLVCKLYHTSVE